MELKDRIVVVTGAASGIGRALALRFAAEGARAIVSVDIDEPGAADTARQLGGRSMAADVSREADVARVIESHADLYRELTGPIG